MSKHRFSNTERYALWQAYDGRCYHCDKPLDFQEMTVDHILPERLGEHLTELAGLRREYEIDEIFPGFQINDYTNWVPAHPKCNIRKGSDIFPKKMTLLLLQDVQRHLDRVYEQLDVIARSRNRSRLLGSLGSAIENSHLTVEQVREFIRA